jgi:hypothetical protein
MGDTLQAILDVTIVYHGRRPGIGDLIANRIGAIHVHVRELAIGPDLRGNYEADPAFRARFQIWMNALWTAKDERIARMGH